MPVYLLAILFSLYGLTYRGPITVQPESVQLSMAKSMLAHTRVATTQSSAPYVKTVFAHPSVPITIRSGMVLDVGSGLALWKKNIDEPRPLASLTKLMTALVFLDSQPDWDKPVTFEQGDIDSTTGNTLIVRPGETATVRDVFMASLVASANNATVALARSTGLTTQEFVQRMNDKAKMMSLFLTTFTDVSGLDPGNTSTARDYVRLVRTAFNQPRIREALTTREYSFTTTGVVATHRLYNTDQLLADTSLDVQAAKTGFIDESGYNFISLANVNSHEVLVVLLGSVSSAARFAEAKALFMWIQDYWRWE
ncbi:MAG: serine hydrolase [Patescibacteria group bacterium]